MAHTRKPVESNLLGCTPGRDGHHIGGLTDHPDFPLDQIWFGG